MPIYTEPEEPEFDDLETRDSWFVSVMLAEYGELEGVPADVAIPVELNWLQSTPVAYRYDFDEAECGMVYISESGYSCSVWDVTGADDDPWAVFVVDEYGARLVPEYSIFDEEMTEEERDEILMRASVELPKRLDSGEFTRAGEAVTIPEWLKP